MKKRWIFDAYNCRSEFVERLFVVAYHYENAIEAIECSIKSKQDYWVNYVGQEQIREDDPSSDVRS